MNARKMLAMLAGALCCGAVSQGLEQTNQLTMVEVSIKMRHGDLLVESPVNGSEALRCKLDTGFGITVINPNRVESLRLEKAGQMTIIGIAGNEKADTYSGAVFSFGGLRYEPKRVAALPSEARRRWRDRDGILGAGFFRRFVVELDIPNLRMRLYEPKTFSYEGKGEIIPISFKKDTPIVEATIFPRGREGIAGQFEIDTGCDGAICLGHEFVAAHRLLPEEGEKDTRRGVGGAAEIRSGTLQELRFGKIVVNNPSANFFVEGSPSGDGQAGHIGLGAIDKKKVIFDYSRLRIIIEQP